MVSGLPEHSTQFQLRCRVNDRVELSFQLFNSVVSGNSN